MDRRRFLTLLGAGGLGGSAAAVAFRRDEESAGRVDASAPGDVTGKGEQRITWSVATDDPVVALTFDDGPDPAFTPRILEVLDRYGVTATFFALGYNAARHPGLLREVVAAGHEIGSHGWRHLNLTELAPEETEVEIEHGHRLVEDHAGVLVRSFRPPYGRFTEVALHFMARRPWDMYVWSVTRGSLAAVDGNEVAAHVENETERGDIVALHDGIGRGTFDPAADFAARLRRRRSVEIDALPQILERAHAKGLRFRTVSQLVRRARQT